MTTSCPCPHPPGGSVTCGGNQFAFCHFVEGELQSGCIPIPRTQKTRPTAAQLWPILGEVLEFAGFEGWERRFVFAFPKNSSTMEWNQFSEPYASTDLLFEAMVNGTVIGLLSRKAFHSPIRSQGDVMLLRFPGIWSRSDNKPTYPSADAW